MNFIPANPTTAVSLRGGEVYPFFETFGRSGYLRAECRDAMARSNPGRCLPNRSRSAVPDEVNSGLRGASHPEARRDRRVECSLASGLPSGGFAQAGPPPNFLRRQR